VNKLRKRLRNSPARISQLEYCVKIWTAVDENIGMKSGFTPVYLQDLTGDLIIGQKNYLDRGFIICGCHAQVCVMWLIFVLSGLILLRLNVIFELVRPRIIRRGLLSVRLPGNIF